MNHLMHRIGMWLVRRSGEGYLAWRALGEDVERAEERARKAMEERHQAVSMLRSTLSTIRLADGLLSDGKAEEAQRQLRFAIAATRYSEAQRIA